MTAQPLDGRWAAVLRGAAVPLGLLVVFQAAAMIVHLRSDTLAAPTAIVGAGAAALADGTIPLATVETLAAAAAGLLIGCVIGTALGILLGLVKAADHLLEVTIETVRPVPSVALIPVAMLVLGLGYRMEIAIVAFAATWPMLIFTRSAVAGVEPRLLEVARMLNLGVMARVAKIVVPAALPRIFVAFRLSVGIALVVAVTVEIVANPLGMGYQMMFAEQSLHPALMLAFLVWIGLIGWALNEVLVRCQRLFFGPVMSGSAR